MSIATDPARFGDSSNTLLLKIATLVQAGAGQVDPDAAAFFTRAGITDATQKSAWNACVVSLKASGLWAKIELLYPLIGGNATAHSSAAARTATC